MQFEVINRPLEYDGKVFVVGDQWPEVDINNRAEARIARMFYEQSRLAPNPKWLFEHVPGAAKWMTEEEIERATRPSVAPKAAASSSKKR